jgi:hypothetical protein
MGGEGRSAREADGVERVQRRVKRSSESKTSKQPFRSPVKRKYLQEAGKGMI